MNKLSGYWVCKYALQTTYMRPCFHKASSQLMLCSIDSDPRPTPPPQKPTLPTTSFRDGSTPDSAVLASNHSHLLPYLSVSSLSQKFSSLIRKNQTHILCPGVFCLHVEQMFCIADGHWAVTGTRCGQIGGWTACCALKTLSVCCLGIMIVSWTFTGQYIYYIVSKHWLHR